MDDLLGFDIWNWPHKCSCPGDWYRGNDVPNRQILNGHGRGAFCACSWGRAWRVVLVQAPVAP